MTRPSIAFVGLRGTGKDTLADRLVKGWGYRKMSWADPVRDIAAMAYDLDPRDPVSYSAFKAGKFAVRRPDGSIEEITGTQVLQRIGTDAIRDHLDADFWIKAGLRRMDQSADVWEVTSTIRYDEHSTVVTDQSAHPIRWVNTDTRFPNEVDALRSRGFRIVGLSCPEDVRRNRLIARDGLYDEAAQNHPSETSVTLDDCDMIVDVNAPIEQVEQRLWDTFTVSFGVKA